MNLFDIIAYPLLVIALLECLLGIILITKNPRNLNANKSLAAMAFFSALWSLCAGVVYLQASMGLDYDIFYRACWIGWFNIPAAFQFVYYFKDNNSKKARLAGLILYPTWILIYTLVLFTNVIEKGVVSLIPFVDRSGLIENPVRFFGALLIVFLILKIYRLMKESTGADRVRLNYFFIGIIIFAAGAAPATGFFQLFGGLGLDPTLGAYASLPWLVLTFYAITRDRLFDIKIAISRTIVTFLIAVMAIVIQLVLFSLLEPIIGPSLSILVSLVAIGSVFIGTPLSQQIVKKVDSIIVGGKYNYQKILIESTTAVTTILDLDDLLEYIVEAIKRSMGIDTVCLLMRDEDDSYRIRYSSGFDLDETLNFQIENGIISWLKDRRQAFIKDAQERILTEKDFNEAYRDIKRLHTELVIPLFFKNKLLGILTLGSKGDQAPYHQSDIDLLQTLANQTSIAIENARLYEEAITDGLTELNNYSYFMARVKEEVARSKRYKHPLSLLMIDLDRFKRVNDKYGHLIGDMVLWELARKVKKNFRLSDVVARYGGEEFVVLLPDTAIEGAVYSSERLRKTIEETSFEEGLSLTLSIGVSCYYGLDDEYTEIDLIKQADKAMYKAKDSGRNKVAVVESASKKERAEDI